MVVPVATQYYTFGKVTSVPSRAKLSATRNTDALQRDKLCLPIRRKHQSGASAFVGWSGPSILDYSACPVLRVQGCSHAPSCSCGSFSTKNKEHEVLIVGVRRVRCGGLVRSISEESYRHARWRVRICVCAFFFCLASLPFAVSSKYSSKVQLYNSSTECSIYNHVLRSM